LTDSDIRISMLGGERSTGAPGPLTIVVRREARQLFLSFVSLIFLRSSTHARRRHEPGLVLVGTMSFARPAELFFGLSALTRRSPTRRVRRAFRCPFSAR
jgi:hypothetical protein